MCDESDSIFMEGQKDVEVPGYRCRCWCFQDIPLNFDFPTSVGLGLLQFSFCVTTTSAWCTAGSFLDGLAVVWGRAPAAFWD